MLLPSEERQDIKRRYAEHVLYKLSRAVRNVFQEAHPEVTISVEQLFADAVEWLDELLSQGGRGLECCDDLWNDVLAMYRERDGQREGLEESKVKTTMVFYLLMYCLQSAGHAYYRGSLFTKLFFIIHSRWDHVRCQQMEQRLAPEVDSLSEELRQWMQEYFASDCSLIFDDDEERCTDGQPSADGTRSSAASARQQDPGRLPLPEELDTERAQKYFPMAIAKGWMSFEQGRYTWHGVTKKGAATQLAYFCGKVYECRYSDTADGNTGKQLPEQALQDLFNVKRLHTLLSQAYNATRPQRWRDAIDALFQ